MVWFLTLFIIELLTKRGDRIMTVNDRILAVHVLQRFVRMSRILLPGFSELMSKNNPTTGRTPEDSENQRYL